jgi:glucosamine-6-phosphate deaminase
VLAIVPEARKAQPVHDALYGPIGPACPASILRTQSQATLYLDADSASLLE